MKRRTVTTGGSALLLSHYARAQPAPLGGPVGYQERPPGPQPVGGGPSLSLDLTAGPLDPRIAFARASVGTYFNAAGVLQTATANTPRFDYDPVTHAARGLLIEEQRTNLLFQSGRLDLAPWAPTNSTITGAATAALDGTTNAIKLTPTTTSGTHLIAQGPAITAGSANNLSIFAKPAGYARAFLSVMNGGGFNGFNATFNLTAGTASAVSYIGAGSAGSVQVSPMGNGWYRCAITGIMDGSSGTAVCSVFVDNGTTNNFVGDGTSGLYLWGGQMELSTFPTSYTPTAGAGVTRAIDQCSMPAASWYVQSAGSIALDYILEGYTPGLGAPCALVGANANTDYIDMDQFTNAGATGASPVITGCGVFVAGSASGNVQFSPPLAVPINVGHRGASAWSIGSPMGAAHDALLAVNPTTVTALPVIANLLIGGAFHSAPAANLWARRVRYWPRMLSNAELVGVTT